MAERDHGDDQDRRVEPDGDAVTEPPFEPIKVGNGEAPGEANRDDPPVPPKPMTSFEKWTLFLGFFGFGVLTIQTGLTRDTMRLQARAWVSIPGVVGKNEIQVGAPLSVGVKITNSGSSPALKMRLRITIAEVPKTLISDLPRQMSDGQSVRSPAVLYPGQEVEGRTGYVNGEAISKALIDALACGDVKVFIYGRVDYEDVFGRAHSSKFCFDLGEDLKSPVSCEFPYATAN